MSHYTCISCQTLFNDLDTQKQHYKSDWHRYNLKRKIAEFPPVSAEEFQQLVIRQRAINTTENVNVKSFCVPCHKSFANVKSYENHLNSKKHLLNGLNRSEHAEHVAEQPNPECEELFEEELDSDEWEDEADNPIEDNNCLFCGHHSANMQKNLRHMAEAHTFFVPDIEYCIDVYGLLKYLGEKVSKGFICLWCNESGRTFFSVESVRQHMLDKGHTKMLHEGVTLAEYVDFYDYSTSYPEGHQDKDEEVEVDQLDGTDYQLVLPSGATVGHRSLVRYYKQSADPNRLVASKNSNKLHKVLAGYKALGWSATQQEVAAKKARDLHYMKRVQAKWNMKLGVKANKLQKHFREQVNF